MPPPPDRPDVGHSVPLASLLQSNGADGPAGQIAERTHRLRPSDQRPARRDLIRSATQISRLRASQDPIDVGGGAANVGPQGDRSARPTYR